MIRNKKLIFIILLIPDLIYTYFAIMGEVYILDMNKGGFVFEILRLILVFSPAIVHYLSGGTQYNFKESKKYTIPLFVLIAINVILKMYV